MQVTTKSALPKVQPTKSVAKAIKQPTSDFKQQAVPWHLQAVLNASYAVLEPPRGIAKVVTNVAKVVTNVAKVVTNVAKVVTNVAKAVTNVGKVVPSVSTQTEQAQQAQPRIVASEFNTQGNLVLTYSDGTKVVSKNKAPAANSFSPAAPSMVIKVNMINL